MQKFGSLTGREEAGVRTVALERRAPGPINLTGRFPRLRHQSRYRLAPLGDDDFLPRFQPSQEAGVAVSKVADGGGFHVLQIRSTIGYVKFTVRITAIQTG